MGADEEQKQKYLATFQERDSLEDEKYQVALDKAMIEADKNARQTAEERAHAAEAQALIMPSYEKYSFKGKPRLNKLLWEESRTAFIEHLNAGNELTKEHVDSVIKGIRASIEEEHNIQATETVNSTIKSKKDEAMTSILTSAQGVGGQKSEDPMSYLQKGNPLQSFLSRMKR
jgi:hypothetical protein